jgi:hypothetical protein
MFSALEDLVHSLGRETEQARSTSYAVLAVSLVLTLVLGVQLW